MKMGSWTLALHLTRAYAAYYVHSTASLSQQMGAYTYASWSIDPFAINYVQLEYVYSVTNL